MQQQNEPAVRPESVQVPTPDDMPAVVKVEDNTVEHRTQTEPERSCEPVSESVGEEEPALIRSVRELKPRGMFTYEQGSPPTNHAD